MDILAYRNAKNELVNLATSRVVPKLWLIHIY